MSTADGSVLGSTQISGSAPRNRAFNVVLLAEGFTAAQQSEFDNACTAFVNAFLGAPPFDELRSAINVFRVNVSSTDSGADDPAVDGGAGSTARTYFDATFGANNIRRLLVCNPTTALQVAAAQVPEFSAVIVVVNSTIYGGSGGGVGTFSLASGATEIAIHEMGHTAFGLADEYPYYAGGNETGHDHHPPNEPSEPNVTTVTDRNALKWRSAVASSTAIPTMSNPDCSQVDNRPSPVPVGTVGLFEGAHYFHCGAYRPEYDCKMRALGVPFCRVCRDVISTRIRPLATVPARTRTPIGVIARYPERLDVFAVATDGRTMSIGWDQSGGWGGWFHVQGGTTSLGGAGSPVTAVARYAGHLDLFTVGADNRVCGSWWDVDSGWHAWQPIGNLQCLPGSTVNVVSRYSDHFALFTTASDGRVMSIWWDAASGWGSWFQVQGGVAAAGATVTAIARYPFHLDVFTIGTDNRVQSCWWDERSGWHGWGPIGSLQCRPDSTVSVVARFADQLDLFTTATNGEIMSLAWNARSGWGNWFQVSGGVASPGAPVTAIARYSNSIDLFAVGADNRIRSASWHEGTGWTAWSGVSGGVGSPGGQVAAISRLTEHIDLFTLGADGQVYSAWWDVTSGWSGWSALGVI
jgi:hypothetical protein